MLQTVLSFALWFVDFVRNHLLLLQINNFPPNFIMHFSTKENQSVFKIKRYYHMVKDVLLIVNKHVLFSEILWWRISHPGESPRGLFEVADFPYTNWRGLGKEMDSCPEGTCTSEGELASFHLIRLPWIEDYPFALWRMKNEQFDLVYSTEEYNLILEDMRVHLIVIME